VTPSQRYAEEATAIVRRLRPGLDESERPFALMRDYLAVTLDAYDRTWFLTGEDGATNHGRQTFISHVFERGAQFVAAIAMEAACDVASAYESGRSMSPPPLVIASDVDPVVAVRS
jgi:hypothetical protein